MTSLRISEVTIADTFGTEYVKFSPGSITRFRGPNGSGKSSVLRGLSKVFEGGSDPSVIRQGAEKSVVTIKLDDGTVITRTTAPVKRRKGNEGPPSYRTDLEIIGPDGTPRNAPQAYINELGDISAVDPGQILSINANTAPGRKQLAEILLRILPLEFDWEEIRQAGLYRASRAEQPNTQSITGAVSPIGLDSLKKIAQQVTDLRRGTGQTRDDSDSTIKRLEQALPNAGSNQDWKAALAEAERVKEGVNIAIQEARADIETLKQSTITAARERCEIASRAIDADIDAKIKALEAERNSRSAAVLAERTADLDAAQSRAAQQLEELQAEAAPEMEKALTAIATAKERLAGEQRASTLRDEITVQKAAWESADWKYDQLTHVLERLEGLRKAKLDELPVPGLVVEGDQVLIDGIPWQNVNTAKRVEIALHLCTLRAGKLGVIFLDDAEHLSTETRTLLEQAIADAGFQLIEAIVSDDEALRIEVIDNTQQEVNIA